MIASTQTTNTEIFAFIAVVLKLLSRKVLFINRKGNRNQATIKSRLLFETIANFTSKLLENYEQLACELFRILLKCVTDYLQVFFQFS